MSRSRVIGAGVTDNNYETDLTYNLRWFLLSSHISFQSIPFQLLTFTCSTNVIAVIIIMMSVIMMSVIMVVIVVTEVVLVPVFLGEQTPLLMLISLIWPEMKIFKIKITRKGTILGRENYLPFWPLSVLSTAKCNNQELQAYTIG